MYSDSDSTKHQIILAAGYSLNEEFKERQREYQLMYIYPKTAFNVHFYMYKRTVCYEKLVHECSFLEKYVSFLRTNFILLIVVERKLYKTTSRE